MSKDKELISSRATMPAHDNATRLIPRTARGAAMNDVTQTFGKVVPGRFLKTRSHQLL
jgi:hypothetical protein